MYDSSKHTLEVAEINEHGKSLHTDRRLEHGASTVLSQSSGQHRRRRL